MVARRHRFRAPAVVIAAFGVPPSRRSTTSPRAPRPIATPSSPAARPSRGTWIPCPRARARCRSRSTTANSRLHRARQEFSDAARKLGWRDPSRTTSSRSCSSTMRTHRARPRARVRVPREVSDQPPAGACAGLRRVIRTTGALSAIGRCETCGAASRPAQRNEPARRVRPAAELEPQAAWAHREGAVARAGDRPGVDEAAAHEREALAVPPRDLAAVRVRPSKCPKLSSVRPIETAPRQRAHALPKSSTRVLASPVANASRGPQSRTHRGRSGGRAAYPCAAVSGD